MRIRNRGTKRSRGGAVNAPSQGRANEIPLPETELEYGEEVLSAGWNPDIEQLAKARERQPDGPGERRRRR